MSAEPQTHAGTLQRAYYASTAAAYDDAHIDAAEHRLGLHIMLAAIRHYGFASVLDVGSGTGRALTFLKSELPAVRVMGIEPSPELRAIGHGKGLTGDELQAGDALVDAGRVRKDRTGYALVR